MTTLITDPNLESTLQSERAASGADRYDEVWEGIYMMNPMPNLEHQDIVNGFAAIFQDVIRWPGLGMVMPGANVSDREVGWEKNYRVPDVAVCLRAGAAKNCGSHWLGGPDFVVEVVSPSDQTREKLDFYASVGVRELLIVDREPWRLEMLSLKQGKLAPTAACELRHPAPVTSAVLSLSFTLGPGEDRPAILVQTIDGRKRWTI